MLVSRSDFASHLDSLRRVPALSVDCESLGLRPYHGHRLFSVAISDGVQDYYFNTKEYPGLSEEYVLDLEPEGTEWESFRGLLGDESKTWFLANAKFDMALLHMNRLTLTGQVHDVLSQDRLIHNDCMQYSLKEVAKRYGFEKSDEVEHYIRENNLWKWNARSGKKVRSKDKDFGAVPIEIISRYAEQDAHITYCIGQRQKEAIQGVTDVTPKGVPTLHRVYSNELKLTKTVFDMERRGVKVDHSYCLRAVEFEQRRMEREIFRFSSLTGETYKASPVLYKKVFASEASRWAYTEKGNPSFESEVLQTFQSETASAVLAIRDAKARSDFFNGFLYHSDSNHVVHPSFNPGGTATGRFSSSDPNLQNVVSKDKSEYPVRRALIPRPGYLFIMPDYEAMEYRLMLDYAAQVVGHETELIRQVKSGKDVHQATADLAGTGGHVISRDTAKAVNFATLYGSGTRTLAKTLGGTESEAKEIKEAIFKGAPEIKAFLRAVQTNVSLRGSCFNWMGRISKFPDSRFIYRAPNYLIQGGCADIVKLAMNDIADALQRFSSRIVMTIHDELVIEVLEREAYQVPQIVKEIMEAAYKPFCLPMKVSMEWSAMSLADKIEGVPV